MALQQIHEDRETIKERNIRNPSKSQKILAEDSDSNATSQGASTHEQVLAVQEKKKAEKQSEKEVR
jgi:hypothetical protein